MQLYTGSFFYKQTMRFFEQAHTFTLAPNPPFYYCIIHLNHFFREPNPSGSNPNVSESSSPDAFK